MLEKIDLNGKNSTIFKKGNKQVAVFKTDTDIFAIDNRCPHEGYPLLQGKHDGNCILTCNWHNWKFDMKTGQCLTGGDNVRTYPIIIKDGEIFLELTEPSKDDIEKEILKGFKVGFEDRQYGRIARELARLHFNKIDPIIALKKAIEWSYDKFEYGSDHEYAVSADWLQLYLNESDLEKRITYLTEAIDYISLNALRHKEYSFSKEIKTWNEKDFLEAVENENHELATSLINGAFSSGLHFEDLEKVLSSIALEHYNDFGHSLIYVQKTAFLVKHLGIEVEKFLTLALVRSIINATREDLLPEFKRYSEFLNTSIKNNVGNLDFWRKNVNDSMNLVSENFDEQNIKILYDALLLSNAKNMLYFDISYQNNTNNKVSDNIGWLDFTHALTFSNAVKTQCNKYPDLWKKGLLQLACFSGRNHNYLDLESEETFLVENYESFKNSFFERILDHGIPTPIFPAHLLKTSIAVFEEIENTNDLELKKYLSASLNRFLNAPLKQKHMKRTIKQGIDLVSKDFIN